jgi:transcriptional regulator of acetoin/glycerol metabolism
MVALTNYAWPGNIPQLERILKHAVMICRGADICVEHLGPEIYVSAQRRRTLTRLESLERDAIVDALREYDGNRIRAAAALGMSRSTLYRRLRSFGLESGRTVL